MADMKDLSFSMKMRDVIEDIVKDTLQKIRPRYQYATVDSVDAVNFKADVIFTGEVDPVTVNTGHFASLLSIGDVVRVDGIKTDKFIADIKSWDGTGVANKQYVDDKVWDGNDITTGVLADARIPNLNGSKITAGTIATARLPASSTTAKGTIETATNAEALAGTDTTRAVTPEGLKSAVDAAISGVIPSSVQVSGGSASVAADGTVTFSGCTAISLNGIFDGLGGDDYEIVGHINTTAGSTIYSRLRKAGVDTITTYYRVTQYSSDTNGPLRSYQDNVDSMLFWSPSGGGTAVDSYLVARISRPATAARTSYSSIVAVNCYAYALFNWQETGTHTPATAHDGISIIAGIAMSGFLKIRKIS